MATIWTWLIRPWEYRLEEKNLAAVWSNYRELAHTRLIYTNTVSVLQVATLAEAMGSRPRVIRVLMRAGHDSTDARLARREQGRSLAVHRERSRPAAAKLDEENPADFYRLETEGRSVDDLVTEVLDLFRWQ